MADPSTQAASAQPGSMPRFGYDPFLIALRYLLKKKLSYLAIFGVMLSVGTIITVTSVFTGFHLRLTGTIRGYLSDLTVVPTRSELYGLDDWPSWLEQVRAVDHVRGVAPFIESFGLVSLRGTKQMGHVFLRGVHPELEPQVSDLHTYMKVGTLSDLDKTYASPDDPDGRPLNACVVGAQFTGFTPAWPYYDPTRLDVEPGWIVLITATAGFDKSLKMCAVNGLFESTYYDYDRQYVIMGLESAMELLQSGGAVTGLSVKLDDYKNADEAREQLKSRLSPGVLLGRLGEGSAGLESVALSNDGSRAAGLAAGEIIVWQLDTGRELLRVAAQAGKPTAIALGPEGEALLIGYDDGAAAVRKVATGEEAFRHTDAGDAVTAARFSPDGWLFAVGRRGGLTRLRDAETYEEVAALRGHRGPVNDVVFDAASERLVTASADGTARLWTADEDATLGHVLPSPYAAPLTAAAFSPDGERLITGDATGWAVLWDVESGQPILQRSAHDSEVLAVAFGGGSDEIMSAGRNTVRLWQLARVDGQRTGVFDRIIAQDEAPLVAAAFRQDGARVLTVGADGQGRLRYSGPAFRIKTWEEQQKAFLEAVAMERFLQVLIMSLILVLAEFFIFAILTTMVNERRRDIGILKAIGFTRGQICLVFLTIGLAIGVSGGLLGVGAGLLFTDNINVVRAVLRDTVGFDPFPPDVYYFKEIPTHTGFLTPALTAGGAIVCSLLFSIFPALRAARLDPVQTLHYE